MPVIFPRFNKLVFLSFVLVLAINMFGSGQAQEPVQNKTFIVIGTSGVYGENIQAARDQAITESLVTAVALMTEEILQVESLVENFPQINEIVFQKKDQYIQDYKVLTETRSEKSYHVIVQATVAGKKIAKQLSKTGILRAKVTLPAVLFFIAEQNLHNEFPLYWWGKQMGEFESISESAMAEIFKAQGFPVVDHGGIWIRKMAEWDSSNQPELSDEDATNLGARLQADVVIVGSSMASPAANIMGSELKSFKGTLIVRALRTETGEELANISQTAVAANADENLGGREALSGAGTLAGEALATQLAAQWRKLAEKPSQVEIHVEGTGNLANFVKFRRALTSISGVEGIRVKEIKPNETILIVDFQGKTEELASALMRQNFGNFGINIYEVTQQNLKIAITSG